MYSDYLTLLLWLIMVRNTRGAWNLKWRPEQGNPWKFQIDSHLRWTPSNPLLRGPMTGLTGVMMASGMPCSSCGWFFWRPIRCFHKKKTNICLLKILFLEDRSVWNATAPGTGRVTTLTGMPGQIGWKDIVLLILSWSLTFGPLWSLKRNTDKLIR